MISLTDYINKRFTVGGTVSNRLIIFDMDDTLIHTTAKIGIVKNNEIVHYISNQEFNTYKLKPGESFDFSQFEDPVILNKEKFTKYWNTLKREYYKDSHVAILTARSNQEDIRDFFLRRGLDLKKELIFTVGDPNYQFKGTIQEKKAKTIELLYKLGYKTFVFFDDNEENLKAAEKLEKKLDIKIHTVKV